MPRAREQFAPGGPGHGTRRAWGGAFSITPTRPGSQTSTSLPHYLTDAGAETGEYVLYLVTTSTMANKR